MPTSCQRLKHPTVRKLCTSMKASPLDVGATKTNYTKNGSLPLVTGKGDVKLSASETFRGALLVPPSATAASKRSILFKRSTGYAIPWIPNKTNRVKIVRELAKTRKILAKVGMKSGHARYGEYIARNINWMIRKVLGVRYRDHKGKEASIDGIIRRKYARCSEYATLFYGIALLAGIKAYPVEVYNGLKPHMAIAVPISKGKFLYFDGQLGTMKRPIYKHYYLGGVTDLFASFLYNSARSKTKTSSHRPKRDPIELAATVAPHNALIRFDLGTYYQGKKKWRLAMKHYGAAFKLRPSYKVAYQRYCFMRIMAGLKGCTPGRRINTSTKLTTSK